jgi:hypothetical protein
MLVAMQRLVNNIPIATHMRNSTVSTFATIRLSKQHATGERKLCEDKDKLEKIIHSTWHLFYNVSYSTEQSMQIRSMSEFRHAERWYVRAWGWLVASSCLSFVRCYSRALPFVLCNDISVFRGVVIDCTAQLCEALSQSRTFGWVTRIQHTAFGTPKKHLIVHNRCGPILGALNSKHEVSGLNTECLCWWNVNTVVRNVIQSDVSDLLKSPKFQGTFTVPWHDSMKKSLFWKVNTVKLVKTIPYVLQNAEVHYPRPAWFQFRPSHPTFETHFNIIPVPTPKYAISFLLVRFINSVL